MKDTKLWTMAFMLSFLGSPIVVVAFVLSCAWFCAKVGWRGAQKWLEQD